MAVRLQHGDTLHGLLAVSIPEAIKPDDDEKQLLLEVAADISFALNDIALQHERHRAQQQLHHKEALLSRSQHIAHLGSWELDFKTNHFTWSDEVFRIVGYPPQVWEPSYERFLQAVHPDDRLLVDTAFSDSLRPGCSGYQVKHRIVRPWGEIRFVLEKCEHLRDEHGQLLLSVGMIQDITERKEAEDAIAAEKEQLAVTLRSIGDGVITTDTSGSVVIMNTAAERLTGWTQQEAYGRALSDVFCIVDEITRTPRLDPTQEILQSTALAEHTNHSILLSRDGSERIIADCAAPINNRHGQTTGVVLVFRDTTEKQKLLETMHRADKLDSLGLLAGGIAHDFNNLLGGIFGYIDLAQECCSDNREACDYLDKALIAYERAKNLTQQLLTFAKGGLPVRKSCDIRALLSDVVSFSLSGSSISCEYCIDQNLDRCMIDDNQISQVLNNITINAQQAMPQGGVLRVSARTRTLDSAHSSGLRGGEYVCIEISDNGIGIPPEHLSRIFDPFFTTKQTGCGLGLATCYSIIQKHDGAISVHSEPGKGSTFTILLPASHEELEPAAAALPKAHQGSGCVLVMDDEEFIREIAAQMLMRMGYTVIEASRGEEVLEIIAKSSPAPLLVAALFDLTIPGGMGGKETVARVREHLPNLPVFASSGYSEDPVMSSPHTFGFTGSICKPYRAAELQELLQQHLH
jgi:PAS domain S-box-containing protein